MKVKYDILYTNGKSETLTRGALSIEQVQMEALRLSQDHKVLKVVYTIQDSLINLDRLECLAEILNIWTGRSLTYIPEGSVYQNLCRVTYEGMMSILSDAEHFYGYNYTGYYENIVQLHWFLERFIEHAKQNILWIHDHLHDLPKPIVDLNTLPLEELFDVYYPKAEFFAEKACGKWGLEVRPYLHQNVQTLKEHDSI